MTWHETTDWSHVLAGVLAMWNSPEIIKCALEIHLSVVNHKIKLFGVGVLAMAQKCMLWMFVVQFIWCLMMFWPSLHFKRFFSGQLLKQDKFELELI